MGAQGNLVKVIAKLYRVIYNKDMFSVCAFTTTEEIPDEAARYIGMDAETGLDILQFISVGYGLPRETGREYVLTGYWEINKKREELQFKVTDCTDHVPPTKDAIIAYLCSNIIKGIGPKIALKVYDAFKEDTISVLEKEPRRLLEVPGISETKLSGIIESFAKHQEMHALAMMLTPYNVSYRTIVRVHKTLGENATQQIRANPYVLCNVSGIGFKRADDIALRMGIQGNAPARVEGAIIYTFRELMNSGGHVYLTRGSVVNGCLGKNGVLLSGVSNAENAVSVEDVNDALERLRCEEKLLIFSGKEPENDIIYTKHYYICEVKSAEKVARMVFSSGSANKGGLAERNIEEIIQEQEEEEGITLADMQREAVKMAVLNRFSVITGGPGSGKTTILRFITQAFAELYPDLKILLAAPTGRAARRMAEQTGMEASTIHKMLGLRPDTRTDFNEAPLDEEMVDADLVIIDESSMIDSMLFAELMHRIETETRLLFLGDVDQLPSVGPGNVLRELLSIPDIIPSVRLNKVFRQSTDNIIPHNAARIRQGWTDLAYVKGQFSLQYCPNEKAGAEKIVQLVSRLMELGEWENTQVLCPMRKRGETGIDNINTILQDIVNPPDESKLEENVGGYRFRVGDRVIQTRNTEQVSNGDMGTIASITPVVEGDRSTFHMQIRFDGIAEELVEYDYDSALEVEPANAITIHKSQGGEFDIVIVPIFNSMTFFLRRNLLYTAITRAKKHVVLVSDEESIARAIRREDTSRRNTCLAQLIWQIMRQKSLQG